MKYDPKSVLRGGVALWDAVRFRETQEKARALRCEMLDSFLDGELATVEVEDDEFGPLEAVLAPTAVRPHNWRPAPRPAEECGEFIECWDFDRVDEVMGVVRFRGRAGDRDEHYLIPLQ